MIKVDSPMKQRIASEVIGTFVLCFGGTGAIVVNNVSGGSITHPGVALTFGLVVAAAILAFGATSGAHFNPAVTVALWLDGKVAGRSVLPQIVAQCCGAIAASLLLRALFPAATTLGQTMPVAGVWQSFVLEVTLTFILLLTILRVAAVPGASVLVTAIAVGAVVALEAMFAGPMCGASMNPARSLGPAVMSGQLESLWIYLSAPPLGAAAGVLIDRLFLREAPPAPSAIEPAPSPTVRPLESLA